MALKGTRASEAWERQVQRWLDSRAGACTSPLQDLVEMPWLLWETEALAGPGGHAMPWPGGQAMPGLGGNTVPGPGGRLEPGPGGMPPRGQEDTSGHDLVDMLRWDLVAMCRPWPEDQEATFQFVSYLKRGEGLDHRGMGLL